MNTLPASIALLVASVWLLQPQQARDNVRPQATGSAAIYGRVTSSGVDPQPLRRARVAIVGLDVEYGQTVITADDGTFRFDGLAAGSYTLSGRKDAFIRTNAGARRTAGLGSPITVTAGEQRRIDLQLPRGGVLTGRVQTAEGEPAAGVLVSARVNRYVPSVGERRLVRVDAGGGLTDDRGVYRIYGLPPGDYVVSARPLAGTELSLQVLTDAEIRDALTSAARTLWTVGRPGTTAAPPPRPLAIQPPRRTVGLTQIYYPGTPFLERARTVRLAETEVRSAVDFDLDYVALATIEGAVSIPLGAQRVQITLANAEPEMTTQPPRFASAGESGQFTFRSVPPGRYQATARAITAPVTAGQPASLYVGTVDVVVSGEDMAGIGIPLTPALTISGRLVFDPPLAAVPTVTMVPMIPLAASGVIGSPAPIATVQGDLFTVSSIVPGTYRLTTATPGIRTPVGRWWLKSAVVAGRELLDSPVELRSSAADAVLTWSERASEISGTVRDPDGRPGGALVVVIFCRDDRGWFAHSRRIAAVRTNREGHYVIRNLPAGDYLVAATAALDMDEWFDPEVLRGLSASAQPLRVVADERHEIDVTSGR